jgi:predicted nucleic-acid-binding protein
MGIINVEGIGAVQIQGDTPTPEEEKTIMDHFASKSKDDAPGVTKFLGSPEFARIVLETGLGIGGSLLTGGAALPATVARVGFLARPFFTQLMKSAAGSAAGSATGAVIAHPIDPKEDIVTDIVKGAASGFLQETIGAPVGLKAAQLIQKAVGPQIKLLQGAKEAEEVLADQAIKIKANPKLYDPEVVKAAGDPSLTLGIKADSRFWDTAQNITEKSFLGAAPILAKKEGSKLLAESSIDDFVKEFVQTQDKTATGELFQKAIAGSQDLWKSNMAGQYKALDTILNKPLADGTLPATAGKIVDMTPYKKLLASRLKELPVGGINTPNVVNLLTRNLENTPNKMTFGEADGLRSTILSMTRKLDAEDAAALQTAQKGMAKSITEVMDKTITAKGFPVEAKNLYTNTKEAYRLGKEDFNDKVIESLLRKQDPADIFKTIVSVSDKPKTIEKTLSIIDRRLGAVGKAEEATLLKDSLKGQFLQNIVKKATVDDPQYGSFINSKSLIKSLDNYPGTVEKLFTTEEASNLKRFANALGVTQGRLSKSGNLSGGVFIQLKQAGAAGTVLGLGYGGATGDFGPAGYTAGGTAAAILVAPALLSKMILNPKFNKYLVEGIEAPSYPKANIAFTRLVGKLAADGLVDKEQANLIKEQAKNPTAPIQFSTVNTNVTSPNNTNTASSQQVQPKINTRITNIDQSSQVAKNPSLFRALNPGDSLGQAIAEKNALR